MKDGSVVEERQPHLRGGAQEPLTRQDVTDKFLLNAAAWRLEQRRKAMRRLKLMAGTVSMAASISRRCADRGSMTKELAGKVAIVTGAGRNIGRAIALTLAEGGASIVVNARSNRAEAEAVAREIEAAGGKALVHIGDVADANAVQAMADAAMQAIRPHRYPRQQCGAAARKILRRDGLRGVARNPRCHARWHLSLREGLPAGAAASPVRAPSSISAA